MSLISFNPRQPIAYYRRDVYGVTHMYIKDPAIAATVTRLTGKKTLLIGHMTALSELGLTFVEVLAPFPS